MSRLNEEASVAALRLRVERLRQALAAAEAELKEALLPPQRHPFRTLPRNLRR